MFVCTHFIYLNVYFVDTRHYSSFSDFGTVLYINSVDFTPDGRSLVKAIGERRFRVVRRDVIDGYNRAWVEFVFDERVTDKSEIGVLVKSKIAC